MVRRMIKLIDMAFSKKKVEERKVWLNAFQEGTFWTTLQSRSATRTS